jgi:hypothetical protein
MRQKVVELKGEIDESTITVRDIKDPYQKWTNPADRKSVRM